jgi:hypothetical protein
VWAEPLRGALIRGRLERVAGAAGRLMKASQKRVGRVLPCCSVCDDHPQFCTHGCICCGGVC